MLFLDSPSVEPLLFDDREAFFFEGFFHVGEMGGAVEDA